MKIYRFRSRHKKPQKVRRRFYFVRACALPCKAAFGPSRRLCVLRVLCGELLLYGHCGAGYLAAMVVCILFDTAMPDETIPQPIGQEPQPVLVLTARQEELCRRLDDLHERHGLKARPSDMFRGALFVARIEARGNTDWMAQAANSLRETLYPFWSGQGGNPGGRAEALRMSGSVRVDAATNREIGKIYGSLNELAHHGNGAGTSINFESFEPADFDRLLDDFERIMLDRLMHQIDVHHEIDAILAAGPDKVIQVQAPTPAEFKPIT